MYKNRCIQTILLLSLTYFGIYLISNILFNRSNIFFQFKLYIGNFISFSSISIGFIGTCAFGGGVFILYPIAAVISASDAHVMDISIYFVCQNIMIINQINKYMKIKLFQFQTRI